MSSYKAWVGGNCCFRSISGILHGLPLTARRAQNRNLHGQYVPAHLLCNPAYILLHLQSDRLLQWLWHHWAALPDKEQFPILHTDSAHPPAICRILPFLIVIYASCPNLLSSFMDSENTWIILQKKETECELISSSGNANTAPADTLHDKSTLFLEKIDVNVNI